MAANNISRSLAELKSTAGSMRWAITVACAALIIMLIAVTILMH